jgi:anti-sigma-K factor RskA
MDLHRHPELLDRIAAAYSLGTLRGGARRRFETMARESATVRAAALVWQERFASITELQPGEAPSPNVWKRIENQLRAQDRPAADPEATTMQQALRRHLGWWRAGALAGALASVAAAFVAVNLSRSVDEREQQLAQASQQRQQLAAQNAQLNTQLQQRPDIQYVAVLAAEKDNSQILVTFDPRRNSLTLKRVGGFQGTPDKALELWALQPGGAAPRSLGMFGADQVVRLQAAETQLREVPALAITLEPITKPPGVPAQGPILWKGALLQTST